MAPSPDQVDVEHRIAAVARREKTGIEKRSKVSMPVVAVKIGNAKTMRTKVTKIVQIKSGIFISVMPGQRMLRIVTRKLTPESKVPAPEIWTLQIQ